jgi:UDP-glucose 4-epimerase
MKVLVTGGAGFIGSHLVDRLVLNQVGEVAVFDDFSRGQSENLSQSAGKIRIVRGDIRDRVVLERAMAGVDVVFHLAAKSSVLSGEQDPDGAIQTNVLGTYEVLKAAALSGVKRVIFTSSREVYGDATSIPVPETAVLRPKNAYGVSKAAAESYCKLFSGNPMSVIIFRLSNVYGPRDSGRVIPLFVAQALDGEPLTVFGGSKILDFLWIGDLIDVLIAATTASCPGAAINIGSGKGVKLVDLAERICEIAKSGSSVRIEKNRQPEVGAFIADVAAARDLFDLKCPEDPVEHLVELIDALRVQKRNLSATSPDRQV